MSKMDAGGRNLRYFKFCANDSLSVFFSVEKIFFHERQHLVQGTARNFHANRQLFFYKRIYEDSKGDVEDSRSRDFQMVF